MHSGNEPDLRNPSQQDKVSYTTLGPTSASTSIQLSAIAPIILAKTSNTHQAKEGEELGYHACTWQHFKNQYGLLTGKPATAVSRGWHHDTAG